MREFFVRFQSIRRVSLSQVVDLDNSLEVTRQELGKLRSRADEEDERWRAREQELLVRLEDSRCRERKLEDQKHNLEVCLADATQQLQELKVLRFRGKRRREARVSICTGIKGVFLTSGAPWRIRRQSKSSRRATVAIGVC